jgi:hypothetical protein
MLGRYGYNWGYEWGGNGAVVSVQLADAAAGDVGGESAAGAQLLQEKYPDDACMSILAAIPNAEDDYCRREFVEMLGWIQSDESVPFLLDELQSEKLMLRLTAAQALTLLNQRAGVDAMIHEWLSCERIADLEGVGPFLARRDRVDAVEAVRQRFAEQPIDQRVETMEKAVEESSERLATKPELQKAVVRLLLAGLADTEVRSGMSGSRGNKSFSDPRVCDLAGYHLNCLDPETFPFDLNEPLPVREGARRVILGRTYVRDGDEN